MTTILQLVLAILVTLAIGIAGYIWLGEAAELREEQRKRRPR